MMRKDGWEEHSRKTRTFIKMPLLLSPWSEAGKRLHGVPRLGRLRDIVDVAWWRWFRKSEHDFYKDALRDVPMWFVDVTQGVQFGACGPCIPTLLQSSLIDSYEADAVIPPKDIRERERERERESLSCDAWCSVSVCV